MFRTVVKKAGLIGLLLMAAMISVGIIATDPGPIHGVSSESAPASGLKTFNGMISTFRRKDYNNLGRIYPVGNDPEVVNSGKYCGLYYEVNNAGERVTLIGVADANADCRAGDFQPAFRNDPGVYVPSIKTGETIHYFQPTTFSLSPKQGYWYGLMKFRKEGSTVVPFDKAQAADHYALVAYPDDYGASGETTFCISEEGTVYAVDFGTGEYVDTIPANPVDDGWSIAE